MRSGPGTFDDPCAKAVASAVVVQLMAYAREQSVAKRTSMDSFQVGESFVVPTLALVGEICRFSGARPPPLHDVEALERFHLRLFERRAQEEYGPELAQLRREEVEDVFSRLLHLSAAYWQRPSQS